MSEIQLFDKEEEIDFSPGERLSVGIRRAFANAGVEIPSGGIIVDIGCGRAPFYPAVEDLFQPDKYIGIDIDSHDIRTARRVYSEDPRKSFRQGDARDLSIFSSEEYSGIKIVLLLQPAMYPDELPEYKEDYAFMDEGKTPEEIEETHMRSERQNKMYMDIVEAYLGLIPDDGKFIITTYYLQEAMVFLRNSNIRNHILVYGVTSVGKDDDGNANQYIIVLSKHEVGPQNIHWLHNPDLDDDDRLSPNLPKPEELFV